MKWRPSTANGSTWFRSSSRQADEFVNQVYIPDLLAVASFYKDWANYGGGLHNYLAYGEFPTKGYNQPESFKYARGAVLNRDLSTVHPVNAKDQQEIKEYIAHSWYTYDGGNNEGVHPWAGETKINYTGPKPPFETLEGFEKYSFLKTPRWKDNAMEVGPLARLLVSYAAGRSRREGSGQRDAGQTGRSCRRAVHHPGPHRGARH